MLLYFSVGFGITSCEVLVATLSAMLMDKEGREERRKNSTNLDHCSMTIETLYLLTGCFRRPHFIGLQRSSGH